MATIYGNILGRGYFPKELPPAFFSEDFARYARSKAGRATLNTYTPPGNFTDLVRYRLALPGKGGLASRPLAIPHPWAFAALASVIAKHFRRLLQKSGTSKLSKSRPIYEEHQARALHPAVKPSNLSREKYYSRAGATHLLRVDISQFYPSLYTHAVGWAIDPKLRQRKYWNDKSLLGKQVDQLLMNMQGKVSQGVPIGNDLSFLLAEVVLSQVDRYLRVTPARSFRWYDDYEIACSSRQEAEQTLVRLNRLLDSFRLRVNSKKTEIVELPESTGDGWQDELRVLSTRAFSSTANMVSYFDHAFRARVAHPDQAVLLYAIGTLFKKRPPRPDIQRVAESSISQALLSEPGAAQKAFALLTFWQINGSPFDGALLSETIDHLIRLHEARGVSSDVAWSLAFCIQHNLSLSRRSGRTLTEAVDDAVAIESLHASSLGLLSGFSAKRITKDLKTATCDGDHWLLLYEAVRQKFIPALQPVVASNPLFADFLSKDVTFYRQDLPSYAAIVQPGGAPEWLVSAWLKAVTSEKQSEAPTEPAVARLIEEDAAALDVEGKRASDLIRELLDRFSEHATEFLEPYA